MKTYPPKTQIARAVDAARACGLTVKSIEISPTGNIRVSESPIESGPRDEFERLVAEGKL